MKKIIYSLVAMLFMGGIITSCIEPYEPSGVVEVRNAYADYLRALAKAKDADAAVQQAVATYELALAAVQQGIAAQEQAKAEWMKLMNDLQKAQNDEEKAYIQERLEESAMQHQIDMAGLEAELATAQKNLSDVLRALEIDGLRLSQEEQASINYIKRNYDYYAGLLYEYYEDLADYLDEFYDFYEAMLESDMVAEAAAPYMIEFFEEKIAVKEQELANAEKAAAFWKDLTNNFVFDFIAEADLYRDSAQALAVDFADLLRDSTIYDNINRPIMEAAIAEAEEAYAEAVKEPKATFDAAVKDLKKVEPVPANKLDDTTANAPKGKAKVATYKFDKGYALPEHVPGDIISTYEAYLSTRWYNYADQVKFAFKETEKRDTLYVKIAEQKKKADYEAIVDTIWAGAQTSASSLEMKTGLWSAYQDFSREYLYDMNLAGLEADADAIGAYKDEMMAYYDSILNILKSAKANQADILLKAWYDKVSAVAESIEDLQDAVLADINYDDDPENDVYSYTDNDTYHNVWGATFDGPIALYRQQSTGEYWQMPRKVSVDASDNTKFTLDYNSNEYFSGSYGVLDNYMTIAPTKADSTKVFNDILNFFKAVAAVDEDAVPFLKFIVATNDGATFEVQKVRADKMEFKGMQMKATDTYLKEKGLYKASTYDNKAIEVAGAAPDVHEYYDAFSNVVELFLHYVKGTSLYNPLYDEEDEAYSLSASGLEDYFDFVEWYYNNNYEGKTFDDYRGYDSPDFVKYSKKSDEGKALYNWLEACKIYFGVDGFGGFGEEVFFTYKTFKEPTNAVIFAKVPAYTKDEEGNVVNVNIKTPELIYRYYSQYGFIMESIENNIHDRNHCGDGYYCTDYIHQIDNSALVFKIFAAEYLYNLATNTESISTMWTKLGEVLQALKADMDKVVTDADAYNKAAKEEETKYNEALATYRAAIKDALRTRDAAIKEAEDTFFDGLDEFHDRWVELKTDYDFYMKMYEDLCGAYALHAGSPYMSPQAIIDYCLDMYEDWAEWCADLAAQIERAKIMIYGIQDETLDAIEEAYWEVVDILAGLENDQIADIQFWYDYWKAAYEAAIAYISVERPE